MHLRRKILRVHVTKGLVAAGKGDHVPIEAGKVFPRDIRLRESRDLNGFNPVKVNHCPLDISLFD